MNKVSNYKVLNVFIAETKRINKFKIKTDILFVLNDKFLKQYHKNYESILKYFSPISGTRIQFASPNVKNPFRKPIIRLIGLYFKFAEKAHIVNKLLINNL